MGRHYSGEFVGNVARGHAGGGALGNQLSTSVVRNCSCRGNSHPAVWTDGGSTTNMTDSATCHGKQAQHAG